MIVRVRVALLAIALLALSASACGSASPTPSPTASSPRPVLALTVTPVSIFVAGRSEPLTLGELDVMLASLAEKGGAVQVGLSTGSSQDSLSVKDLARLNRRSRSVIRLAKQHGLGVITSSESASPTPVSAAW
jgi:hypothetical protein